ncbi:MAG: hypothetical protein O7G88_10070, partial [bacterium]|nr:hypothetical protein [bacterium]
MRRKLSQLLAIALMLALMFSVGLVTESEAGRNPCNPCAAKNPCNPCAAKSSRGAAAKARMIIAKVVSARPNRLAVKWQDQTLSIGVSSKTQFRRGATRTSVASVKPGEQIIVSMIDRKGTLNANYVYLAKASVGGNPCNPCAAKNPCNPCATKMNPCNPCAAKN